MKKFSKHLLGHILLFFLRPLTFPDTKRNFGCRRQRRFACRRNRRHPGSDVYKKVGASGSDAAGSCGIRTNISSQNIGTYKLRLELNLRDLLQRFNERYGSHCRAYPPAGLIFSTAARPRSQRKHEIRLRGKFLLSKLLHNGKMRQVRLSGKFVQVNVAV